MDAMRVMILEDRLADQELIKRQVIKFEPKSIFLIAKDKATFLNKIDWFLPDLILSDYYLPDYTGLDAFVYVKEHKPYIPFIFVTGGLKGDDPVAQTILKVADGFIFKDDLSILHTRIKGIMDNLKARIEKEAEVFKRQNNKKVKLLKVINTLQASGDFTGKDEILDLLRSFD